MFVNMKPINVSESDKKSKLNVYIATNKVNGSPGCPNKGTAGTITHHI